MKMALLIFAIAFSQLAVQAQEILVGPGDRGRYAAGSEPLIKGSTDKERWANFTSIQPTVIGMNVAQIEKILGKGHKGNSYLSYSIVAEKKNHKPNDILTVEVTFHFDQGKVENYEVHSVHWGG